MPASFLKAQGFTLIELLVVVAIIGVLASIVLTSLSGTRVKGRDAARVAALQEIGKAIAIYDSDPAKGFYTAVNGASACGANADVTACLGVGVSGASINDGFSAYKDPLVGDAAGNLCSTLSTGPCQYSIATAAGGAGPTTQNFEVCAYLEQGTGIYNKGLISVSSVSGDGLRNGCQ